MRAVLLEPLDVRQDRVPSHVQLLRLHELRIDEVVRLHLGREELAGRMNEDGLLRSEALVRTVEVEARFLLLVRLDTRLPSLSESSLPLRAHATGDVVDEAGAQDLSQQSFLRGGGRR